MSWPSPGNAARIPLFESLCNILNHSSLYTDSRHVSIFLSATGAVLTSCARLSTSLCAFASSISSLYSLRQTRTAL